MLWELFDILLLGLRLRCPCCGHGRLFKTAFRVHDHCSSTRSRGGGRRDQRRAVDLVDVVRHAANVA